MCLIITKPKGTPLDSFLIDAIFQAHSHNRDGLGVAIKKPDGVYLKKGLLEPSEIAEFIEKYDVDENDELLFHARIRTAGSISDVNCHPFILNKLLIDETDTFLPSELKGGSSNVKSISNELLMAHNGGMAYSTIWADKSDTYHVALNPFSLIPVKLMFRQNPKEFEEYFVEKKRGGSRLCFMSVRQDVEMKYYGGWQDYEGLRFSHGGHLRKKTVPLSTLKNSFNKQLALIYQNDTNVDNRVSIQSEIDDKLSVLSIAVPKKAANLFNSFDEEVNVNEEDRFHIQEIMYDSGKPSRVVIVIKGETMMKSRFCFDLPIETFRKHFDVLKPATFVNTFETYINSRNVNDDVFEFNTEYYVSNIPEGKFKMIDDYTNDEKIRVSNWDIVVINSFDPMTSTYFVNLHTSDNLYTSLEIERKELLSLCLKKFNNKVEETDDNSDNKLYTIFGEGEISKGVYKELIKCLKSKKNFKYKNITYKDISNLEIIQFLDDCPFSEKDAEYKSLRSKVLAF